MDLRRCIVRLPGGRSGWNRLPGSYQTYCRYEAPEAIRAATRKNNIPADAIIEIGGEIGPNMFG
jgi:hypothetical protein